MPSETEAFEHYRILRRDDGSIWELGRGAMGVTYKAIDDNLHKVVALKVINALHVDKESSRDRFLREARAAASLNHRNVAGVYHLGQNAQNFFYAMEFIDGETVDALVKRAGPLSWRDALPIVAQVTRALQAAHEKHLIHRDIKPANIMLVPEPGEDASVVKLIDFGLAKTLLEENGGLVSSHSTGFVGTPLYASPEQCNEDVPDIRSDIYSLGVTLWYMLTGTPPFVGSLGKVFSQHLQAPPAWDQLPASIPAPVRELLARMLAKDRSDRPQTPIALRREIEACLRAPVDAAAPDGGALAQTVILSVGTGTSSAADVSTERPRAADALAEEGRPASPPSDPPPANPPVLPGGTVQLAAPIVTVGKAPRRRAASLVLVGLALLVLGAGGWFWRYGRDFPHLGFAQTPTPRPTPAATPGRVPTPVPDPVPTSAPPVSPTNAPTQTPASTPSPSPTPQHTPTTQTKLKRFLAQARAATMASRWSEAVDAYSQVLALDPQSLEALVKRASAYVHQSQPEKVKADLSRAISSDPRDWLEHLFRGEAFLSLRQPDKAKADFLATTNLLPRTAYEFRCRGIAYKQLEKYDVAVKDYDEAIRQDPYDADAFCNRGIVYEAQKHYDLATKDYDDAIRLAPGYGEAFYNRGNVHESQKQYDLALKDYDEAIRLDPSYSRAFNNRGALHKFQKQPDLALKDYDEAIRLDPDYAIALNNRGVLHESQKQYDLAVKDYDEAIRLDPNYARAFSNRGVAYNGLKRHERAIQDFNEAIGLDPTNVFAYRNRGVAYSWLRQYEQAIQDFNEAIRLDSQHGETYSHRAFAERRLGRTAEADADDKKAAELQKSL